MLKHLITHLAFAVSALATLPAYAIGLATNGDILFVHSAITAPDIEKFKEKLTPEIKYVVLRSPTGGTFSDAELFGHAIEAAKVTTVAHGACMSFACQVMFMSGTQRMFSGEGRPESHYLRIAPVWSKSSYGAAGGTGKPWIPAYAFWSSRTELTGSTLRKYLQDSDAPDAAMVFFHPSAKPTNGPALGCRQWRSVVECSALPDGNALQMGIITTAERFERPGVLIEGADIARPAASGFAKLDDVPGAQVMNDQCRARYADFLKQDKPRAFVLSSRGGCYSSNAQYFRPYKTVLDRCQGDANQTCKFYAVDDLVVFEPFVRMQTGSAMQ